MYLIYLGGMKIFEKLMWQKKEAPVALLFKEGVFYKCYNEGAFALRGLNFRVFKKNLKTHNICYTYIGFTEASLNKIKLSGFQIQSSENPDLLRCFNSQLEVLENDYQDWIDSIPVNLNSHKKSEKEHTGVNLKELILEYSVINRTPIEVMNWLSELQRKLQIK